MASPLTLQLTRRAPIYPLGGIVGVSRGRVLRCFSGNHNSSTPLSDLTQYENKNNSRDQVFSALSHDGGVKVTACTTKNLTNELIMAHLLTSSTANALGTTVACGLLLSNGMQAEQTVQLTLNVSGPIGGIVAIATGSGKVRGYVENPNLEDMELPQAVGRGSVRVVKTHPDWRVPYNGITEVRTGEIDRDLGIYLADSEQRSCILAAGTTIDGLRCTGAGGYLIEKLPGADLDILAAVQNNLDNCPGHKAFLNGLSPLEIADIALDGLGMTPLQEIEPKFECPCTSDRLIRALLLLSRSEVDEILEQDGKVEATCEFCGTVYNMSADEVREEMAAASDTKGNQGA